MAGTWRDPDNFRARWRKVREDLGVPDVTQSLVPQIAGDVDRRRRVCRPASAPTTSATPGCRRRMDTYMARGRVHTQVAELLDRRINDE